MFHRFFIRSLCVLALCLPLLFTSAPAHAKGEVFYLVSHAPDTDTWWNTIKKRHQAGRQADGCQGHLSQPCNGRLSGHGFDHQSGGSRKARCDHHDDRRL